MRNVSQRNKKTVSVKAANNYERPPAHPDRPFNRLLEDRESREEKGDIGRHNGSAKKGSSVQQIMDLLRDFNVRLKKDETDRERLWKEMESMQSLIARQKKSPAVNTSNIDKWRRVMEDNQKTLHTQIKKTQSLQDKIEERIQTVETTSGSVAVRFEEVLQEQKKLSRRVDVAVEDKEKLFKKINILEEGLEKTQETLRAKALVLLTDQAIAETSKSPKASAFEIPSSVVHDEKKSQEDIVALQEKINKKSEYKPVRSEKKQDNVAPFPPYAHPLGSVKNKPSRIGSVAMAASIIAVLAISSGVAYHQLSKNGQTFSVADISIIEKSVPQNNSLETVDMASIAPEMNAIEPSIGKDAPVLTSVEEPLNDISREVEASEQRDIDALLSMVDQGDLQQIIGVDSALPSTVKEIEKQALAGNASAQHDLAAIYTAGHGGTNVDFSKASRWFEQAAVQGVANARYNLAVLYHQGLGVEKNEEKAISLYKTAASLNHPEAQYNLGIAYIEGIGIQQDVAVATHYFEEAAKNDVMEAAYNLGLIHENGLLGFQRPDEALFWYKVASAKGSAEGRQALEILSDKLALTSSDVNALVSRISLLKPDVNFTSLEGDKVSKPSKSTSSRNRNNDDVSSGLTDTAKLDPLNDEKNTVISTTNLAPGSDAVIVSQIQDQLINLGLYPGPADGVVGPVTQDAVRSYQSLNGLSEDGFASEDLLVHMLAREFELGTYPAAGVFKDVGSQE